MIKTLSQALRMDKERFKVPKSVQQAIPIQQIWPDGIFQQGTKFSKTYRFTDINYYIASKDNKTEMFLDYSELLNSLDSGISAQITINNRRINKEEFEKSILLPMKEDGLDHYREEYNEMLLSKITGTNNSIYQERYLTVSVHKRSIDDARTYFARIGTDIVTHLAKLSSTAEGLDAESRLQIFRDFFKGDVPQAFPFDLKQFAKKGTSFKDWMCPDSMEFERDHFKIGDRYGRVLYMQDYASYVKDDMISELCDFSRNLMLSIDILPVPTDEAVREIQNRLLGVETNVTNWQRRQNGNSFRLGVSGSGKSFSAKEEIVHLALSTDDDILILDPESEFTKLVEALGGQVVKVSATSDNHLNAMDMDAAYGNEKNPLIEKSEFILSVFEQLVGAGNLSAKEKSILDRCAADVYRDYIRSGYTGEVPTLKDMYRQLMLQPEEEARGLALSSELFINGSLNTFAQPTNVNKKNRIMDYDIRELGEQLMPLGMLVTLDSIFNRVIQNWKEGKTTWIFADEFYLLFRYEYSANFFYRLYKRIRKYNGFVTGLTQNVEELLKSDTARLMLANSEFLILLNQASTDREELAALLNISENQLSYITNVSVGSGLIRCSGNIVPFENTFPKNTDLYKLMTTKPGES